jgi:hypothetical protein
MIIASFPWSNEIEHRPWWSTIWYKLVGIYYIVCTRKLLNDSKSKLYLLIRSRRKKCQTRPIDLWKIYIYISHKIIENLIIFFLVQILCETRERTLDDLCSPTWSRKVWLFFHSIYGAWTPQRTLALIQEKTKKVVRQESFFLSIYGAWTLEKTLALIQEKQRKLWDKRDYNYCKKSYDTVFLYTVFFLDYMIFFLFLNPIESIIWIAGERSRSNLSLS